MAQLNNSVVPIWNEEPRTLDAFEERVILYVSGTKKEERHLCGPRLLAQMDPERQPYKVVNPAVTTTQAGCRGWSDTGDCGSATCLGSSSNSRSCPSLSTADGTAGYEAATWWEYAKVGLHQEDREGAPSGRRRNRRGNFLTSFDSGDSVAGV